MKILVVDDERDVEILFRQRFRREVCSGEIELLFAFAFAALKERIRALAQTP